MTIKLYKNLSENNVLNKNIDQLGNNLTGTLREDCSVIDPVFRIAGFTGFNLKQANYAYISEFGRYYYINNIVCLTNNLYELHLHVDVLKTYASQIRKCNAVISRQEHTRDLYLNDGVFKTRAFPQLEVIQFGGGFTDYNYIFTCAG